MILRRRPAALAAVAALGLGLLTWTPNSASAEAPATDPSAGEPAAAGLIVKYTPDSPFREAPGVPTGADSVSAVDIEVGRSIGDGLRTVKFSQVESATVALEAAAQLESDPAVLFAEPDWVVELARAAPRATQSSPPWGLDRIDQRLGLDGTYTYGTTGQGVDVYVVDSGIRATHADLIGRVAAGANFHPGVSGTNDCNGHGTHVAGTIGGTQYGIAKQVTLIPVRVFACSGSTLISTVVAGMNWILDRHTGARPAVANLSLGGGPSASLDSVVAEAVADGITVVVASGNDNQDACDYSPARAPTAITVNASTDTDDSAVFSSDEASNWGACTDIYAPGADVLSSWHTSNTATARLDGTSMASPHVAGAAARILQSRPTWSPRQVWSYISEQATPVNFPTPSADNPHKLLYIDPVALVGPDAPTEIIVSPDYDALDVSWTAPAQGPAPGWYAVQHSIDGATWINDDSTIATATSIAGLDPASGYLLRVRSVLGDDSSAWMITPSATAPLAPSAPGAVSAIEVLPVDDTTISVTWSAPSVDGGRAISYYKVAHSTDDSTWSTDDTTAAPSTTVLGLATGTPVRVRVSAVNAIGTGVSSASTTLVAPRTLTLPGAPATVTTTAGDASLAPSWSAPSDTGGRPITSYAVEHSTDDSTWSSLSPVVGTSTTLGGLANGTTYSVRVAATTIIGTGAWTTTTGTPVAPSPPPPSGGGGGGGGGGGPAPPPAPTITSPGAPTLTSLIPGDRSVAATWSTSDDTGGEAPESFIVELDGSGIVTSGKSAQTSTAFVDLTNGTAYRLRVAAINSAGQGDWSTWSADVTPHGPASAPISLTARAGDASVQVTWAAPETDGGSAISGYSVEVATGGATQLLQVTNTSTTLVGLINDQSYVVRVAAMTGFGLGTWSVPVSVTPRVERVTAPRNVNAIRTPRAVTVTWQAPAVGVPLRYVVLASINGKPFRLVRTTKTTRSTFGVKATVRTVRVQVLAVDTYGQGPRTSPIRPRQR